MLGIAAALALPGVAVPFCVCGFSEVELSWSAISLWLSPLGLTISPACVVHHLGSSNLHQLKPIEAFWERAPCFLLLLIFRTKDDRRTAAAATAQRLASNPTAPWLRCLVLVPRLAAQRPGRGAQGRRDVRARVAGMAPGWGCCTGTSATAGCHWREAEGCPH